MKKNLEPKHVRHGLESENVDIWPAGKFAENWLKDTLNEAGKKGRDPRRREIIFAVCFAESYLIEWLRDVIFKDDIQKFQKFVSADEKMSATEKWKELVICLERNQLIKKTINYKKDPFWGKFVTLVKYRNAITHAGISLYDISAKQKTGKTKQKTREK